MLKPVTVKKNERGPLLRNGDFERVLHPGSHWLFAGLDSLQVELLPLEEPSFELAVIEHPLACEPGVAACR